MMNESTGILEEIIVETEIDHIIREIHNEVYDEFVYDPFEYWNKLYEGYRPILVVGDRTVNKYEVAIQICKYFDKDFTIEKGVFYDFDKDCFEKEKERALMFPSFSSSVSMRISEMMKQRKIIEKMVDSSRMRQQYYIFVVSGSLRNVSSYILSQISDVVRVKEILNDYIVCEHEYFYYPNLLNKYTRLRYFNFDDLEEYTKFLMNLKKNMFTFPTKYPRLDEATRRKFDEHRRGMMDDLIDSIKKNMKGGDRCEKGIDGKIPISMDGFFEK